MRLLSFYVSSYKNLKNFTMDFAQDSFLEVFVGKNGSGKSNFIEALVDVFRHIYEYDLTESYEIYYDYKISYELDGVTTNIEFDATASQLKINNVDRQTVGSTPTPDNVLIYYAGHNRVIDDVLNQYAAKFSARIRTANSTAIRKFIGVGRSYNDLFLAVIMLLPIDSPTRAFVLDKLGIVTVDDSLKVNFKRPLYANGASARTFDVTEEEKYWKLEGVTREFVDTLEECRLPEGSRVRTEGYLAESDTYQLYCSLTSLRERFGEQSSLELFKAFDNLKTLGMLDGLTLNLRMENNKELNSNAFSDGQFQTIYLFAISEIFKDANCITLMDEPDSFLHPEWQAECSTQVQALSNEATASNHVLMTTHSAVTLINSPHARVRYFDMAGGQARTYPLPKREAVKRLCSNVITYTEQEQILSILNAIQIENKPVLFTEGSTDPIIIKEAWLKLYDEEIPFIPFYAFSCTYLCQLLTDARIHNEMNNLPVFGLFDFDKAFDTWNGLNGEVLERNPHNGLRKKWANGKSYAVMLPVPTNADISRQVLSANGLFGTYGGDSLCEIEHLFYGRPEVSDYFDTKPDRGGHLLVFKSDGNKTTFAKEVVPSLPGEAFEPFRPILEFIKQKCLEHVQQPEVA
ncbi:ATP-binding protein [Morganella morganii]|nr:ATP-binding protein [Morganella morganii]